MQYTRDNPLIMIPGPIEADSKVLQHGARRMFAHTEAEFIREFQELQSSLRTIFGVSSTYSPVVIAGGGTLAMEIAILNLIDTSKNREENKLLIFSVGYFGSRFSLLATALNVEHKIIHSETGSQFTEEQIRSEIDNYQPAFACIQHVDTSTGVANNIEVLGKVCAEKSVISIVDGVCALGAMELQQENWGIDIYLTGAQKALGVPPGLAILMYSENAKQISKNREEKIPGYYADLTNWWSVLEAYDTGSAKYFSTPATGLILSLAESCRQILGEGLENRLKRHADLATYFREEMQKMGYEFVTKDDSFANSMTTPKYLDGVDPVGFRNALLDQGVLVAGGIQSGIANSYFRVGHMGIISKEQIDFTLDKIKLVTPH